MDEGGHPGQMGCSYVYQILVPSMLTGDKAVSSYSITVFILGKELWISGVATGIWLHRWQKKREKSVCAFCGSGL